ncbi:cystatin-related protein 1-like [Peromyscus maniculatus bairdii]|uniref:cystatin-related protein 1-like n=1 Tax=Peromyscus maniculatus bairdii TaxID=230844 RepID=UPI003FD28611
MGKTLWISLILQATFILLLNSSHAKRNTTDIRIQYTSVYIPKQFALDIINIIYNLRSNSTYLSKIMSDKLKIVRHTAYGGVELRPTTCSRAESALNECPLNFKLVQFQNQQVIFINGIWIPEQRPCSMFLSELSNCPFSEHPDHQKNKQGEMNLVSHPGTFMITLKMIQKVKHVVSITDDACVN